MAAGIVIVGGGAAGLLAAASAAARLREAGSDAQVVVLEAAREPGRKILVSGGGHCNVLPLREARARFVSSSPRRLVDRCLDRFPLAGQRAFFEEILGGPLREEASSAKLFPPSNRARDVRDALVAHARSAGAECGLRCPCGRFRAGGRRLRRPPRRGRARRLSRRPRHRGAARSSPGGRRGRLRLGRCLRSHDSASLSRPRSAHGLLPRPRGALRGLSGGRRHSHGRRRVGHDPRRVPLHPQGLERPGRPRRVARRLAGARRRAALRRDGVVRLERRGVGGGSSSPPGSGSVLGVIRRSLPDRVAALVLGEAGVAGDVPLHRLTREARHEVVRALTALPLPVEGTEGYRTAEVTAGGVALEEVDPGSGASRLVPGLFLAGEILDATGPIGGFNFQWAWATGRTAGDGAARSFLAGAAVSP
ncbi:MAG: NAD(P)/FAD-dependent oxidoreductase [Holophagales bacterium]|nr:NAD(P)/FAD-dependent oxidoreductase [Holophagales bacterium]